MPGIHDKFEIQEWLKDHIARLLNIDPDGIQISAPFSAYGLSSLDAITLSGDLEVYLGRRLSPTLAYEYPNIASLAEFLAGEEEQTGHPTGNEAHVSGLPEPFAIIGMSCRFPGATNPESFWTLLNEGTDAISEVPPDRWNKDAFYHPDPTVPGKAVSRWGGFLEKIDEFDPFFFGISPAEAKQMDPQQRLLMELSFEALDDAGQAPHEIDGSRTGVFIGISVNEYSLLQFDDLSKVNGHSGTGSALSIAANRISYTYNFHGPSMVIDTACSSSLAAVHLACQSLRNGECTTALAGGVNMILSAAHSVAFTKAGVLAPDGKCKTFDAAANGYVRGEGGGLVVIKPLSSAIADGDQIYAVIRGSAMAQDGRTNGLVAPSKDAQAELLRKACEASGVYPGQVQYIEAHGTGTLLGDSMEAQAIGMVMGVANRNQPCLIGSVKTNIGHLESAAGIAGLIKVILGFKHGMIPASIHYQAPNPHIPFASLNLEVNHTLRPWPADTGNVIAGVSSFGFGGTNVHLIVSTPPDVSGGIGDSDTRVDSNYYQLPLSANSLPGLHSLARSFYDLPGIAEFPMLENICYGAGSRRSKYHWRLVVTGHSASELRHGLLAFLQGAPEPNVFFEPEIPDRPRKLAFVFSGQGGQWVGMGRQLLQSESVFRNAIDRIDRIIREEFGWSVLTLLTEEHADSGFGGVEKVQPALFAIQVAISELLESWGITPAAVVGHSMGEIAAAHRAGILKLADAVRIACIRSSLLTHVRGQGSMLATGLTLRQAEELLTKFDTNVSIAAINGPESIVLSGPNGPINNIAEYLDSQDIFCRPVNVDVASHSPQMDQLQDELMNGLQDLDPDPPILPFYSTVTGHLADRCKWDAQYWMDNIRKPVLFSSAIDELLQHGYSDIVEIGPHPVLLGPIEQLLAQTRRQATLLPALRREESEREVLLRTISQLYVKGYPVKWKNTYPNAGKVVPLPMIPWNRQRYWVDPPAAGQKPGWQQQSRNHPLLGERISLANSPAVYVWQLSPGDSILPYVQDHLIDGEVLFPAACYFEMAFQSAREAGISHSHSFGEVVFLERLAIDPEKNLVIQSILSPATQGDYIFNVYSRYSEHDPWTTHLSATFKKGSVPEEDIPYHTIPDTTDQAFDKQISGIKFYEMLQSHGLTYGPGYQTVENIRIDRDQAVGLVTLTSSTDVRTNDFQIHPALLDGCFQVLAAAGYSQFKDSLYLPAGCKKIRLFRKPGHSLWSHVRLHRSTEDGADEQGADIRLYDREGLIIAEFLGLRLRRSTSRKNHHHARQDTWLYQLSWQIKQDTCRVPEHSGRGRHWLILADDAGFGKVLAGQLEANGDHCHVLCCSEFMETPITGRDAYLQKILRDRLSGLHAPLHGVIHLWSLSITTPHSFDTSDAEEIHLYGSKSLLYLVQALSERTNALPRLWVVTRGVQPVNAGDQIDFAQAPVWGLGKVIGFEIQELGCHRIDIDPSQPATETIPLLVNELNTDGREDQVAFRNNIRYVHRLQPFELRIPAGISDMTFKRDATYLITGGFGGLGIKTAEWMANNGAMHLALMGRRMPSPSALKTIDRLRANGIQVLVIQSDVSDPIQVNQAISEIETKMPPLRGVIHAAGILDDASLLNLNWARMKNVIGPKLDGTWNLHVATLDLPLDFFVLFSSAVSVLGSPGQGNYAAASACLDAMAHYRTRLGLPAISINWGPWADVGLAAEATERLKEKNSNHDHLIKVIQVERGLEMLGQLLGGSISQVMILPFDLKNLVELYPAAAASPFLSEVGGRDTHVSRLYARPALRQSYVAPRNEIEGKLAQLWQRTLHIDRVGVHDSFFELGGDSVLAAQVLSLCQKSFGIRINPQEAFNALTIEKLANLLETEILKSIEELSEEEANKLFTNPN